MGEQEEEEDWHWRGAGTGGGQGEWLMIWWVLLVKSTILPTLFRCSFNKKMISIEYTNI
jgi:hypothetical protein